MEPTFTWLDLTASDRDKMRRVLDLFKEQGTVDELGLGTLRDALSNALFPGTSSIQTRLRYALFVPWIYQELERKHVSSREIGKKTRKKETALIGSLVESNDGEGGVIGERAGATLSRLPSSVYWAALVRWGIFSHAQSQSWYHTHFAGLGQATGNVARADDPGVMWANQPNWHRQLPNPPASFPNAASFALTRKEAIFLRGRIVEHCPGSLLSWLAENGSSSLEQYFWDDPNVRGADQSLCQVVELARRFSLHVEGGPLLYNLMLAQRRHVLHGGDERLIEDYRIELDEWAVRENAEDDFDPATMWAFLATRGVEARPGQVQFLENWSRRIAQVRAAAVRDDSYLESLIEARESTLKVERARLRNSTRLLDWSGRVGIGRMNFRWGRVRQLLTDLHRGLEQ